MRTEPRWSVRKKKKYLQAVLTEKKKEILYRQYPANPANPARAGTTISISLFVRLAVDKQY
jgi:hypothetical protein